jgi:hypothetical protein
MQSRIGLAVCRHLLPEARAACRLRGLRGIIPLAVEPRCDRPWPDWPDLLASVQSPPGPCDDLIVVGAGCLPAGSPPSGTARVRTLRSSTCFALLTDEASVDACVSRGCYLVTPGWLGNWRHAVASWGYDMPTARAHFREFARTILLLDTGTDPDAPAHLRHFARFLALDEQVQPVALDAFSDRLSRAVKCRP